MFFAPDSPLQFVLTEKGDSQAQEFIKTNLKRFNDSHSPLHKSQRKIGRHTLDIYLRNTQNQVVGGLMGGTYWSWLSIDELWIEKAWRGQGVGSKLIQLAEEEALNRKCRKSQVKTWSFQAKEFYIKQGYQVTGKLEDYPEGMTFYWLYKSLV